MHHRVERVDVFAYKRSQFLAYSTHKAEDLIDQVFKVRLGCNIASSWPVKRDYSSVCCSV